MPFTPPRLLLAFDPADGLCTKVTPKLITMLTDRAFEVDVHEIGDAPAEVDLYDYAGVVLGTPSYGMGVKGVGPTERVSKWIEAQGGMDEVKVAVFCVYQGRQGHTLRNLRQYVLDAGGEVVVTHAYWAMRPEKDDHILPAECMVRIR